MGVTWAANLRAGHPPTFVCACRRVGPAVGGIIARSMTPLITDPQVCCGDSGRSQKSSLLYSAVDAGGAWDLKRLPLMLRYIQFVCSPKASDCKDGFPKLERYPNDLHWRRLPVLACPPLAFLFWFSSSCDRSARYIPRSLLRKYDRMVCALSNVPVSRDNEDKLGQLVSHVLGSSKRSSH
jgi:hypothetical protein